MFLRQLHPHPPTCCGSLSEWLLLSPPLRLATSRCCPSPIRTSSRSPRFCTPSFLRPRSTSAPRGACSPSRFLIAVRSRDCSPDIRSKFYLIATVRRADFETLGRGTMPNGADAATTHAVQFEAADGNEALDPGEPAAKPSSFAPWTVVGSATAAIDATRHPFATNPHSLRLTANVRSIHIRCRRTPCGVVTHRCLPCCAQLVARLAPGRRRRWATACATRASGASTPHPAPTSLSPSSPPPPA